MRHNGSTMPNKSKPKVRKLWSTGNISDLIGVNPKKVADWIDLGELKNVTLPGLDERRVHREELRRFLERYEFVWALRELDIEEGLIVSAASRKAQDVPLPPPAAPAKKKAK